MLSYSEARTRVLMDINPTASECVDVSLSLGRILYSDISASTSLPTWDNSAMDGVALRAEDSHLPLTVQGVIAAGDSAPPSLRDGCALKIMTGAPLPGGANAVVPREECNIDGDHVRIHAPVKPGQHIRSKGSDIEAGKRALTQGTKIKAGEIALLSALGITEVKVSKMPRVAILSTGSELVEISAEPKLGQVRNSNNIMLARMVEEAGGIPIDLGFVSDERAPTLQALRAALRHDAVITSGGVSVGDFDEVKNAMADLGIETTFWKVAMKPGKPLFAGRHAEGARVFGLPGNPVSAYVSFELFVRPYLQAALGATRISRPIFPVVATTPILKKPGRTHFIRAQLHFDSSVVTFTPLASQSSGSFTSMRAVEALIELPESCAGVSAGDTCQAHCLL